jgi:hypothetical protein
MAENADLLQRKDRLNKLCQEVSSFGEKNNLLKVFVCLPKDSTTHDYIEKHKVELLSQSHLRTFVDASDLNLVYLIQFTTRALCNEKKYLTMKKHTGNDDNTMVLISYNKGFVIISPYSIMKVEDKNESDKIITIDTAPYIVWLKEETLQPFLNYYNGIIKQAVKYNKKSPPQAAEYLPQGNKDVVRKKTAGRAIIRFMISTVIIAIVIVFISQCRGCYKSGYESGIEKGERKAEKDVAEQYESQITNLESELNILANNHKKRIAGMRNSHSEKLNSLESSYSDKINSMQSDYEAEIRTMQNAHQVELQRTRESSYRAGQEVMKKRIDDMIDLNVENKEIPHGWNDPVYSVKN